MAKVLVQMLWCDPCQAEGTDVEGVTQIVGGTFGGPTEVWEIELCKEHSDAPFTQVQAWAAEYGRDHSTPTKSLTASTPTKVKPPKSESVYAVIETRDGDRLQCPYCFETRATPGRVDNHIRKSHPGEPLGTS